VRRLSLSIVVSAAILALLVWRTRPWDAFAVTTVDGTWLVVAVALNLAVIAAWAFRSASLMGAVGYPIGAVPLVPVVAFANTINNLTPASSGEVLRAIVLQRRFGVAYAASAAVILVERFWAIGIMGLTAGAAALAGLLGAPPWVAGLGWVTAIALTFVPTALGRARIRPLRWLASSVAPATGGGGRRERIAGVLRSVDERLDPITGSAATSGRFVAWTAVVFAAYAAQLFCVVHALQSTIDPSAAWAALGLATIAGVLSALPFGLGATDVVLLGLLGVAGLPASTAAAAVLLYRVVATFPLGIVGSAAWVLLNRPAPNRA
jgi:glycosyltransferase 2 family protein